MTTFSVDAGELFKMAVNVDNLSYQIQDQTLNRDALSGVAGSDAVDAAYHGFVQHWSDGLWKMSSHLQALSDRLADAAGVYTKTERSIANAALGQGAAGGGGGGGAGGGW